jgi:hypothetical protein
MKKYLLVLCLSMAALMMVTPAYSEELWDFHLRGVDEGLAAGALPPPGFYFINDLWMSNFTWHGVWDTPTHFSAGEAASNIKLTSSVVDVPILIWVPGCKIFGADYGAAIAQPFDTTNLRVNTSNTSGPVPQDWLSGAQWGTYNTIVIPFLLSWKLCDFRVKAAMQFGMNDGWNSPGNSQAAWSANPLGFYHLHPAEANAPGNTAYFPSSVLGKDGNVYAWSANDSWQFTPNIGISWLHAGWNVSADLFYTWYTKDSDTDYQNGDEFSGDYTITYTCGKWTFGLGAETQVQVNSDKFDAGDGTGYHSQPNTKNANYTMGPIIGYNFGPCSLMGTYNFPLATENDFGGPWWNIRLVVPLGNPCPIGR